MFSGQTKNTGVIGAMFSAVVILMATSSAAQADCSAQIRNKMNKTYSFQILKGSDGDYTEVQRGSLPPGASANFKHKTSYGGMVIRLFVDGQKVWSSYSNARKLANCTFSLTRNVPYCTGFPRARDLTILPDILNCGRTLSIGGVAIDYSKY